MPDPVDNLHDVRRLVKQLGIKVETVDDLHRVLAAVNSSYNPDAVRVATIRVICTTAISVSMGSAGIVSFFALVNPDVARMAAQGFSPLAAVLIIMWLMAGAVSLASVLVGLRWLKQLGQPSPTRAGRRAEAQPASAVPGSDRITTPENIKLPRELP